MSFVLVDIMLNDAKLVKNEDWVSVFLDHPYSSDRQRFVVMCKEKQYCRKKVNIKKIRLPFLCNLQMRAFLIQVQQKSIELLKFGGDV